MWCLPCYARLQKPHANGLRPLAPLLNIKLDALPLFEGAEALPLDGREVDKDIIRTLTGDEAIALLIIKPLNGPGLSSVHFFLLLSMVFLGEA